VIEGGETTPLTTTLDRVARQRGPVVALLIAKAISGLGNTLTALAIPWFVLITTESAARTGVAAFAQMLPTVLSSFFGGALVDRVGYKRLSITADLASGLTVGAIPLLYHTVGLHFWQLLILVFLGAVLDAPGSTARDAMLPDLVERAGTRLERANSASHLIASGTTLVGPVLAGVLVAVVGASKVLWIDAASFFISAMLFAVYVPEMKSLLESGGRYIDDVLDGLRFLRRDSALWTFLSLAAILNFVGSPLFAVVLPVYANDLFDSPRALGVMIGGFGAGAIVGALAYGAIAHRYSRWAINVSVLALASLAFGLLITLPSIPVSVIILAVMGFANGTLNPLIMTVLQERTPPELRGRVFGTVVATALIAAPAGLLLAGLALETIGIRAVLGIMAGAFTLVTLVFLVRPSLRQMERTAAPR
jgi:MFS family permease